MTTTDRPTSAPAPTHPSTEGHVGDELDNPEHFFIEPGEPWPADVPRDQDITWWRYRDDPAKARRSELRIMACWTVAMLCAAGLIATYLAGGQPQVEGALLFVGFGLLGAGMVIWARDLLPGHEVTAKRTHQGGSHTAERSGAVTSLARGTESMARRPALLKMLGLVGGVFGLAAVMPIASLGPRPHRTLYATAWRPGSRLVDQDGRLLKPGDVVVDGILTVFPEGHIDDPQSSTVLINLGDAPFLVRPGTQGWNIGGLVAFSKICTHAGCPVGLYQVQTHQLVCPCHQSTFDVLKGCNPVFGPASRSLPQLPLAVNTDGYLVAQSDYTQPVGPGFWNRA